MEERIDRAKADAAERVLDEVNETYQLTPRDRAILAALLRSEFDHAVPDRWQQATDDELSALILKVQA